MIKFKKLRPSASLPTYVDGGAGGADLRADIDEPYTLESGERILMPTGLSMEMPPGMAALILPRSGMALKCGLTVLNAPGLVDSSFRGEVCVILINHGELNIVIRPGDRIAQMLFTSARQEMLFEVESLRDTERGAGGFGSSGS